MCCQSNSTFFIFAVLVVCCRPCRLWRLFLNCEVFKHFTIVAYFFGPPCIYTPFALMRFKPRFSAVVEPQGTAVWSASVSGGIVVSLSQCHDTFCPRRMPQLNWTDRDKLYRRPQNADSRLATRVRYCSLSMAIHKVKMTFFCFVCLYFATNVWWIKDIHRPIELNATAISEV